MVRRRVTRRLAHLAALLALLLATTFAAVLAASTHYELSLTATPFNFRYEVTDGCLFVMWLTPESDGSHSGFGNPGWRFKDTGRFGLVLRPRLRAAGVLRVLTVPLWIPLLLWIGLFLLARRAARAADPESCPRCAYLLTGLPPDTPCPECGQPRTSC